MKVLVVGGAGYIGSHCVRQLRDAGHNPVVLDNLVFGHRQAVASDIPFYDFDLGDYDRVAQILKHEKIENLAVVEVYLVYEWELGSMLIFDRTRLHCSSCVIDGKKIGLTTFTKK